MRTVPLPRIIAITHHSTLLWSAFGSRCPEGDLIVILVALAYLTGVQIQYARVYYGAMMKRRTQRTVHPVFQIQHAPIAHHVREQVAVEGGILGEQCFKIQGRFGGDQIGQLHLLRGKAAPITRRRIAVVWVWPALTDRSKNHYSSIRTNSCEPHISRSVRGSRLPEIPVPKTVRAGRQHPGSAPECRGHNTSECE